MQTLRFAGRGHNIVVTRLEAAGSPLNKSVHSAVASLARHSVTDMALEQEHV